MAKKLPRNKIQDEAKSLDKGDSSTDLEKKIFDLPAYKKDGTRESSLKKNPYVVLKYFQSDWECFSAWSSNELQQFSKFLGHLGAHTWESVYKSGGTGPNKLGLGYTQYKVEQMKAGNGHVKKVLDKLSEDISIFELRLSQEIRVHGFQSQAAFFMILLDKDHRVFPGK